MRLIVPKENFDGYPDGKRASFAAGVAVEVPDDFADLVIAKGQAKEQHSEPAAEPFAKKGAQREAE
ncbi:MAG: hypothetical protein J0H17_18755 [Rhizobiales bacterium]|nr:hypothetical protein [Hyphomicrobiales bacterium]